MSPPAIPPAGTSPAGFFLEEIFVDETKPPGILADAVDPRTGELLSISRGFEPTDAAVLAALAIKRGSGAAVDLVGQRYQDLQILDSSASGFITAETQRALGSLITDGQIKLESVTPLIGTDWAEAQIVYLNRAQNRRQTQSVLLGAG